MAAYASVAVLLLAGWAALNPEPMSWAYLAADPGAAVGVRARRDRAHRPGARVLAALQAGVRAGCPGGCQPAGGGPLHQAAVAAPGAAHHRFARRSHRAAPAGSAPPCLGKDPRRERVRWVARS